MCVSCCMYDKDKLYLVQVIRRQMNAFLGKVLNVSCKI